MSSGLAQAQRDHEWMQDTQVRTTTSLTTLIRRIAPLPTGSQVSFLFPSLRASLKFVGRLQS